MFLKYAFVLLSFFLTIIAQGALPVNTKYGTCGYGPMSGGLSPWVNAGITIKCYHLIYEWSELRPQKTGLEGKGYKWSLLDDSIETLKAAGIPFSLQISVGPGSPGWILKEVGSYTTTGGGANGENTGPYPDYMNPKYKNYYYGLFNDIAAHLKGLISAGKITENDIVSWQIAEGTTGDEGPYKGDPPAKYVIDPADWTEFKHEAWAKAKDAITKQGLNVRMMINTGNDGEDVEYVLTNYPNSHIKTGNLSHQISFDGEKSYFARSKNYSTLPYDDFRSRGEAQGFYVYPSWQQSPLQLTWAMVGSALAGGLDMFNYTADAINKNVKDVRLFDFFNRHSGARRATDAKRGFSSLRYVIDFLNTVDFPENIYGPMIDPSKQKFFDKRVADLQKQYASQPSYLDYLMTQSKINNFNGARGQAIINKYQKNIKVSDLAYPKYDPSNGDPFNDDFGYDVTANYEKFVTQINPESTSVPLYRVGTKIDMHGRYARRFKVSNGMGEMSFLVDPGLAAGGKIKNNLTIEVTYYDLGKSTWSIDVYKNKERQTVLSVTNSGTKTFKTAKVQVNNFKFAAINGANVVLKLSSGASFPISLIEVENVSKK